METLATTYYLRAGNIALTAAHSLVSGPDLRSLHRSAGEDASFTVMLSARDRPHGAKEATSAARVWASTPLR